MCQHETIMAYICLMNSLQSTKWPGALVCTYFTLLIYGLNKHAYHIAHYTAPLLQYTHRLHINTHIHQKSINYNIYLPHHCKNICQQQICPSKAKNMPDTPITQCGFMREVCQYTSHIWSWSHQWCSQITVHRCCATMNMMHAGWRWQQHDPITYTEFVILPN